MHWCQSLSSSMDSKKLEQLFTPRRKVISGLNLGVGASLILIAILFVTYSYTSPVLNPRFYTPAVNSSSESSTAENHVANSDMQSSLGLNNTTMLVNLTKEVEDKDGDSNEGEGILGITHMGNTTEVLMGNGSLHVEDSKEMGNVTKEVKDGVFDSGNYTEIPKGESLHGEVGNGVGNLSMVVKEDVHAEEAVEGSLLKNSSNVTDDHQGSWSNQTNVIVDFDSQTWEVASGSDEKCDIFDGKWVRDDSKPYYPGGSCPHVDKVWNCHANRRPDNNFLKWKWQPNHCDIPRYNAFPNS